MEKNISENFCWQILEDHFKKKGFVDHQIKPFNDCIESGMSRVIQENEIIFNQKGLKYNAKFTNIYIPEPVIIEEDRKVRVLYPAEARVRDLTYDSPVFVDIIETFETEGQEPEIIVHKRRMIARIPIMLGSSKCNLMKHSKLERTKLGECEWDEGGYFIIKGKERVLVGQLRGIYNHPIILVQKSGDKYKYVCDIRSMSEETGHSVSIQAKIGSDDRSIVFSLHCITELIPVGIVFKALGFLEDEDIFNIIGNKNEAVQKYIKYIIRDSYFIKTQKDALRYIGKYSMYIIKEEKFGEYGCQVVENEILPHMGISSTIKEKACFLGSMVSKLLNTNVGIRNEDDRDNYCNKRVEMSGVLCCELFRTLFKRYTKKIKEDLEKKKQRPDILSVISKNTIITTGLRYSFATGNWGVQKNSYIRTGVSQVLQRMTFGGTLSHKRRLVIPIGKEGKNPKIRQTHSSQIMYLCPNECFDPETPILLWNGTIKLAKDIKVGDILIDDKGNQTSVRSTTSGETTMYEIQQTKNNFMNYTVTDNHILTLKIRNHKRIRKHLDRFIVHWFDKNILKHKRHICNNIEDAKIFNSNILEDDILDIKIEDYLKLPQIEKDQLFGFKSSGINWEKQEVEIDPYILGMWLGDGLSTGKGFSSEDIELVKYWENWALTNNTKITLIPLKLTDSNKDVNYTYKETQTHNKDEYRPDMSYYIGVLARKLKKYNLINNKHIPKEYLLNDRETRLKVLAGLIDTDGSVRSNGHEIRFCQGPANTQVVIDALFLAQSLGFSCHLNDGESQWTHKFEDGTTEKRFSTYKELSITGEFLHEIPTILSRKKLNPFTLKNSLAKCGSYLQSKINVIKKDFAQFVGWQLNGNGRFLLGDFTTVHNTPEGSSEL